MDYWDEYKEFVKSKPSKEKKIEYETEKLWPLTIKNLENDGKEKFKNFKPKGLILTVGFSPEPLAGSIKILQPSFVTFVHTKESESAIDQILKLSEYPVSKIEKRITTKDDPISLYDCLRASIKSHLDRNIEFNEIALDPTGGTKIMSFMAGLLSQNFNLNLVYVSNDTYDTEVRRPVAGKEYFALMLKTSTQFPDGTFNTLITLIDQKEFQSALTLIKSFADKTNPVQQFVYYLLEGLSAWDAFNYLVAEEKLSEALLILKKMPNIEIQNIIQDWIKITQKISNNVFYKVYDIIEKSERLKVKNALLESVITVYTGIEHLIDNVLRDIGIDREKILDEDLKPTKTGEKVYGKKLEELDTKEKIIKAYSELPIVKKLKTKPDFKVALGLAESLPLLLLIDDNISMSQIGPLMGITKIRNDLVHRFKTVEEKEVENFIEGTKKVLKALWKTYNEKEGLEKYPESEFLDKILIKKVEEFIIKTNLEMKIRY